MLGLENIVEKVNAPWEKMIIFKSYQQLYLFQNKNDLIKIKSTTAIWVCFDLRFSDQRNFQIQCLNCLSLWNLIQIQFRKQKNHCIQFLIIRKTMYHKQKDHSPIKNTFLNQQTTMMNHANDDDTMSSLKDTIISMEYRLKVLEGQVNSKIEREQCLTLMERKSNTSYMKKALEQVYTKIQSDRLNEQSTLQRLQHQQKQVITSLKKKLKQSTNSRQATQLTSLPKDISSVNFTQNLSKKLNKTLVKPQELYLQSNQTMFSMLIDEIKELKQQDQIIQRLIESKHKKNVSLNNQVCRKLQNFQRELEQTVKYIDHMQTKTTNAFQVSDGRKSTKKTGSKSDKPEVIQRFDKNTNQTESFQSIRIELLSKSIQSIQKQLAQKINIKDILQLIKQNMPNFEDSLNETKTYVEQNFESMRKILENQSEINEQISKSNRVAWWHCYDKFEFQQSDRSQNQTAPGYILFSKQIMNIIPQSLVVEKDEEYTLKVLTKGWYLVHVYHLQPSEVSSEQEDAADVWLEVNNGVKQPLIEKQLMNLPANSQLRLITCREDLFVQVQKL